MVCRLVAVQVKVVICSNCINLSDIVCRLAVFFSFFGGRVGL
uniref:Uncharacterized protein n=1 Tax=Arundo donax TaxID=35708 RepID=A0A0A9EQD0_ARUDO